jgi:thioredoxin 1
MATMISLLLSLAAARIVRATSKTFQRAISKDPLAIVLFSSGKRCPVCKKIAGVLDQISGAYVDAISMIVVDADMSADLLAPARVEFVPTILLYRQGQQRMRYYGGLSAEALTEFCESVVNDELVTLADSFSVFEFQHRAPANLILSDPTFTERADALVHSFGGALHVGILEDQRLREALNLSAAFFSRPCDLFSADLANITWRTIQDLLAPEYEHIGADDLAGLTQTPETILVLLDEQDPGMVFEAIHFFRAVRDDFKSNVSFQYCDFFTCQTVARQVQARAFTAPLYVRHLKQGPRQRLDPYPHVRPTVSDLVAWAKFQIMGVAQPQAPNAAAVPWITARDFLPVVLDPTRDVVLLVGAPQMELYDACLAMFEGLIRVFDGVPGIAFFQFNPLTEHVRGLGIPKSRNPQISIWPASRNQAGSAFPASAGFELVYENVLKLIALKPTARQLAAMAERVAKLRKEW